MKKRKLILASVAVALVLILAVPAAMSYFTTYVRVPGSKTIHLSDGTKFKEENVDGIKHVIITADEDSDPVFVRVAVYAPSEFEDQLVVGGEGWSENKGDAEGGAGYWYFETPLKGGESASDLTVALPDIDIDKATFNVVVVHEYVPAEPDGKGGLAADWENTDLNVTKSPADNSEGGGN